MVLVIFLSSYGPARDYQTSEARREQMEAREDQTRHMVKSSDDTAVLPSKDAQVNLATQKTGPHVMLWMESEEIMIFLAE